jgi:nitroimidazol reductase NimA-like FMN-containing flavoprotein (pyridoxamine 5'-phosphate oxidase superfamily)
MPKLKLAERDAFLAEAGHMMDIATLDAEGAPLATPIWYIHEDGRIWFTPRQHSEWLKNIRNDPRVALVIDEHLMPYRKVLVRGKAEVVHEIGNDGAWRDRYRRIAQRYIPVDDANAYVDGTDDQPRALCSVTLADVDVKTWRMPVEDEPYQGIWAKRYWTEDAKVKNDAPTVMDKSV